MKACLSSEQFSDSKPVSIRENNWGFTLLEMLVSMAILGLIVVALASFVNLISNTYKRTSGKLDTFESARAAFDTMARAVRQATLFSYLGYDNPDNPTKYELKSDLHFISGPASNLGLTDTGIPSAHALFFQAPVGWVDRSDLQSNNSLLNSTGFFVAYGKDPAIVDLPPIISQKLTSRFRFRFYEYLQPRESMSIYEKTIAPDSVTGVLAANDAYDGTDWFTGDVTKDGSGKRKYCHLLAENVVALAILPVIGGTSAAGYLWNSRTNTAATYHRMPQAVKLMMAVIDDQSAIRLGNSDTPPTALAFPPTDNPTLFSNPANFDADVAAYDASLRKIRPALNYRIFTTEVPLNASNSNL